MGNECRLDVSLLWARYVCGFAARALQSMLFLAFCVPAKHLWMTEPGSRTLYAYFLHPAMGIGVIMLTCSSEGDLIWGPCWTSLKWGDTDGSAGHMQSFRWSKCWLSGFLTAALWFAASAI